MRYLPTVAHAEFLRGFPEDWRRVDSMRDSFQRKSVNGPHILESPKDDVPRVREEWKRRRQTAKVEPPRTIRLRDQDRVLMHL